MQRFFHEWRRVHCQRGRTRNIVDSASMVSTSVTGEVVNAPHRVPHGCTLLDIGAEWQLRAPLAEPGAASALIPGSTRPLTTPPSPAVWLA